MIRLLLRRIAATGIVAVGWCAGMPHAAADNPICSANVCSFYSPVTQHQLRDRLPTRRRHARHGLLPDRPAATLATVGAHGSHRGVRGLHRRNLFGQPRVGPGDACLRPNRRHRPIQLFVRGQWGHLHGHLRSRLHNLQLGNHTRRVTRSSDHPVRTAPHHYAEPSRSY